MLQLIAQIRNNLLFETRDEYDCSQAPFDWSTRGTPHPYFGSLCILVSCLGLGPYLACTPILWDMRRNACYKMMFCLAIMDMGTLVGNIFGGVIFVTGGMFCHAPKTFYAISFLAVGCFFSSCGACLMIAFNRFVELFNNRPLLRLYQGNRPWILMILPILYGLFGMLCTPFTQANSEAHIFMLDPMIHYTSYFLVANNFISPTLSTSLYLIMIFRIIAKRGTMTTSDSVNRAAVMATYIFKCIQAIYYATQCKSAGLSCMVGGSSIGLSESTISFFIFLYVLAGLPPFVYITFNPTIRKGLIQIAAPNQSMFVSTSIRMTGFSSIHPAISSPARIESSAL